MASLLLAAGEPGHRRVLPHSRVMLHQPSGGAQGQASDIAIAAKEILKMRELLNTLYVKHTGQAAQRVGEWCSKGGACGAGAGAAVGARVHAATWRTVLIAALPTAPFPIWKPQRRCWSETSSCPPPRPSPLAW